MYEELVKRMRSHNGWALNKTLNEAADAIEELSKPKWIPVTEDSPKEGFPVLGAFKFQGGNGCIVTERITINGEEIWSAAMGMKPFAWMPLPEPPKEET